MKRILFFAALVLGVVSCQKDQFGLDVDANGEAAVTVEVALSEAVTRAVAGGSSALGAIDNGVNGADSEYDIRYTLEVYDNAGKLAKRPDQQYSKEPSTTFALRLIPGRDYRFVVWADFVKKDDHQVAYYNVEDLTNVFITGTHNAMNESRDAYTAVQEIKKFGSASKIAMTLTRPFAKLRVVTNDMNEIYSKLSTAKVVYTTPIYTAFNALDEKVRTEDETKAINVEKTIDFTNEAYLYEGEQTADGKKKGEQTLFADYLFGTEDGTIKFTLDVTDNSGQEPIPTIVFNTNIPVQRNYLTTIYGPVLTDANNVTVTIDDNFANWENTTDSPYYQEVWDGTSIREPKYNAETKTYTIEFPAELAWVADQVNNKGNKFTGKTVKLASGIDLGNERWTPIGATGKFEGTFDGSNLTISNFVIRTEGKAAAGLFANAKYVRNVTVTNVDIESNYKTGAIVGDGLCSRIDNCHVDNARIVVTPWNKDEANNVGGIVGYLSAETEAWVKGCSVKNSRIVAYRKVGGIAGAANQAAVVTDNTVENVDIYADMTSEYKEDKAADAGAIVGYKHTKATVNNNTNTETTVNILVDSVKDMTASTNTNETQFFFLNNGEYTFNEDVTVNGSIQIKGGNEAELTATKLTLGHADHYAIIANDDYSVLTIDAELISHGGGVAADNNAKIVFNGKGIDTSKYVNSSPARYNFYASRGGEIVVNSGTFKFNSTNNTRRAYVCVEMGGKVIINGGTFGKASTRSGYTGIRVLDAQSEVIVYGGTFGFDPSEWVAPGYVAKKDGANWVVEAIPASSDIADAISKVEDGGTIVLADGNYTMPTTNGKDITIVGDKNTIINVGAANMGAGDVTLHGVTIKAGSYKGFQHSGVVTYNNVTVDGQLYCYGEKNIFNKCTFELDNSYVWAYGSKEVVFEGCTFNTNGKAILVYNEGAGATKVAVNNCTFNATAKGYAGTIANQSCAAIEIDNFQTSGVGAAHNITISNNTVGENFSGEWRLKKYVDGAAVTVNGTEYTQIAIDGKLMTINGNNVTVL
ncbi:MAG: hypothetical protein IIU78_02360 [Alistipes sp.]|nr:hypothetical protein [Alistipes sp.]